MNREKFESPGYGWDWNSSRSVLTRSDARFMIMWRNWQGSNFRNSWPTLEEAIKAALGRPEWIPAYIVDRVHNSEIVHEF